MASNFRVSNQARLGFQKTHTVSNDFTTDDLTHPDKAILYFLIKFQIRYKALERRVGMPLVLGESNVQTRIPVGRRSGYDSMQGTVSALPTGWNAQLGQVCQKVDE